MKKFLFYLSFFLLLANPVFSKMSLNKQDSLINSNQIAVGMNCSDLENKISGYQGVYSYSIQDSANESLKYVLLFTHVKKENNIYYLCKQKRYDYASSDSIDDQLKDQNLHKIFYESYEMIRYVFTIADENFTKYMMSRFNIADHNLDRSQLILAFTEAQNRILNIVREEKKETKVAKKPVIKKEKKVAKEPVKKKEKKVAKVVERSDTTPPVIKIASKITVNDAKYSVQGEVSDKGSKKIYINVKDEFSQNSVKVVNGKFTINRYSPEDEEIEIIATDSWGNKSKKIVKVKIERKVAKQSITIEKLNPGKLTSRKFPNRVALIVGIQDYSSAPKATFASSDAKWFREYATNVFGVTEGNIKSLIGKDANFIQTQKAISKWLPSKIKANQSELIIFFAGHGLSTPDGKELYLLVHDSDTDLLSRTAILRSELFKDISKLKPKSVTLFLDTCYSGTSRDDKSLLASARPIRIVSKDVSNRPNNFTIFSAAKLDQISSGFKEVKHGIFSYYLMKGLEGKADANNDRKITNGELHVYLDQYISQKALQLGRKQNPDLAGDHKQILTSY